MDSMQQYNFYLILYLAIFCITRLNGQHLHSDQEMMQNLARSYSSRSIWWIFLLFLWDIIALFYFLSSILYAGKKLAESIVNEKLAACVNIVPGMVLTFLWYNIISVLILCLVYLISIISILILYSSLKRLKLWLTAFGFGIKTLICWSWKLGILCGYLLGFSIMWRNFIRKNRKEKEMM